MTSREGRVRNGGANNVIGGLAQVQPRSSFTIATSIIIYTTTIPATDLVLKMISSCSQIFVSSCLSVCLWFGSSPKQPRRSSRGFGLDLECFVEVSDNGVGVRMSGSTLTLLYGI
ncbi:hypothetical protein V6N13_108847 [Hibiscus sabdariffa]|uniref:Uncharacterized protein n=1 Tax=Hibiscus sabdariffa TaxID=183260 RepID=A0ABR2FNC7_9ROSI